MTTSKNTKVAATIATAKIITPTNAGPEKDFSGLIDHIISEQEGSSNALRDLLMFMWSNEVLYSRDECRKFFNTEAKSQPAIIRARLELSTRYRKLVNDLANAKAGDKLAGKVKDKDIEKFLNNKIRSAEAAYRDCLAACYAMRSKTADGLKTVDARVLPSGLVQIIDDSGEAHKLSASALAAKGKAYVSKAHPRKTEAAGTAKPTVSGKTVELLMMTIVNVRSATAAKQPVRNFAGNLGPLYAMLAVSLLENMKLERQAGDTEAKVRALDAVSYKELVKELMHDAETVADKFKAVTSAPAA